MRDSIDRLYKSRKEGGRELNRIEDCIDASILGVKSKERQITETSDSNSNIKSNRKTKKLENRNGKKNICMDTSNDKWARLHIRRPGHI